MDVATFFIDHYPSNSRVGVEFAVQNKKVVIIGVTMMKGNVIPLNEVRACATVAKQTLLYHSG